MISALGGWRRYGRANGRTLRSCKKLEVMRSSCNLLPMPASRTSSQMSVTNTKSSQTCLFKFLHSYLQIPTPTPPEVSFDLYAENHQIPLTEFCNICMIPSDGSLAEPRPTEFEDFCRTLTVGDEWKVSAITAGGLHFPAVRYFALFITECLLAREKVGALSSPDLAVLCHTLEGDNTYSLGAIVARRLHLNKSQGKIQGGIFATRLAAHFEVEIRPHDYP